MFRRLYSYYKYNTSSLYSFRNNFLCAFIRDNNAPFWIFWTVTNNIPECAAGFVEVTLTFRSKECNLPCLCHDTCSTSLCLAPSIHDMAGKRKTEEQFKLYPYGEQTLTFIPNCELCDLVWEWRTGSDMLEAQPVSCVENNWSYMQ